MSIFKQVNAVRDAQARVVLARQAVAEPATALLDRCRARPLTTVGMAAGAGVALGALDVHPLRVPGLGALLSGTAGELVSQGVRLAADYIQGGFDAS